MSYDYRKFNFDSDGYTITKHTENTAEQPLVSPGKRKLIPLRLWV